MGAGGRQFKSARPDFSGRDPSRPQSATGGRHWDIFTRLCDETDARGNLVPDAWLAALAIESGCEFITTDRDYARFTGLRWTHPLKRRAS